MWIIYGPMGARVTSETRDRKIFRFTVLCLSSQIPYKEKKMEKRKTLVSFLTVFSLIRSLFLLSSSSRSRSSAFRILASRSLSLYIPVFMRRWEIRRSRNHQQFLKLESPRRIKMEVKDYGLSRVSGRVLDGPTNPMVTPLLTDLYQFTMAYAYWKAGKHQERAVWVFFPTFTSVFPESG